MEHHGYAALHVQRAPAPKYSVNNVATERRLLPTGRTARRHIDVALEQ